MQQMSGNRPAMAACKTDASRQSWCLLFVEASDRQEEGDVTFETRLMTVKKRPVIVQKRPVTAEKKLTPHRRGQRSAAVVVAACSLAARAMAVRRIMRPCCSMPKLPD
jgi:hypothetical protein